MVFSEEPKKEKISIIIPTKNEERYLPDLLETIKRQSLSPFEIIVADSGSDDCTKKISKIFGARITGGGLPATGRNNGAKKARGDIFYFFDADVILPPDFLQKSLEEMRNRNFKVMIADNIPSYRKGEKGRTSAWIRLIDRFYYTFHNFGQRFLSKLGFPVATSTCIICEKNIFNKIKGFDEKIPVFNDSDFVVRASKEGKVGVLSSTSIFVSTRRFDKKGHFLFPLEMGFMGLMNAFFKRYKKYNYF